MDNKKTYECRNCGHKIKMAAGSKDIPECCDRPMQKAEPLPVCNLSETAEHSRMDEMGEPCDDGRSGKL